MASVFVAGVFIRPFLLLIPYPSTKTTNTTTRHPVSHQAVYLIERWIRHVDPPFRSAGICIIDKLCHEVRGVCVCYIWGWMGQRILENRRRVARLRLISTLTHPPHNKTPQAKKKLKDGNVFVPRFRLRMADTVDAVRGVKSTGQRVRGVFCSV